MSLPRLNLPGRLARAFIESRLTLLLMLSLLFFGLIGLTFTPREENPQIIVPAAEISIELPGALPEEVEHRLLTPLEAELLAIDGVKHVYGHAFDGKAVVQIEFEVGEDKERALVRLYDRVFRFDLPADAKAQHIRAVDVDDVPVFTLTLTSPRYDDYALRRIAERVAERLRSVKGVGQSYVVGGRSREIRLETTPERLQAYAVSLDQLAKAVRSADMSWPIGVRVAQDRNHSLRLDNQLQTTTQIEQIAIAEVDGRLVQVGDLATVIDGPPSELTQMNRFGFGLADPRFAESGEPEMAAVTVAIAKRSGVNAVILTEALRNRVTVMQESFLPPDVHLIVTRDDGIKADRTVSTLVEHLFIAVAAVSVVLWIFLGWRAALLVAITIPLVFAVVMGMDLIAGPTLNRITLYALILALGMLVDDAIVVIENTHRHYQALPANASCVDRSEAAIKATHEIGNPTTLATFTVVTVFLSLTLVTGMLGQYFYPITFNVPVAMIASLVIAYAITPWLARRYLTSAKNHGSDEGSRIQRAYCAIMDRLLRKRWLRYGFYLLLLITLFASLMQPAWQFLRPAGISGAVSPLGVPLAFLPKDNKNTFLVHIHLPETSPLVVTDRAAREVGELLRRHPEVLNYQTHVGYPAVVDFNGQLKGSSANIGPQFAEIRVNLTPKVERDVSSIEIVRTLRPTIEKIAADYPGGIIQLVEDPPGPPVRATVLAEVYGPDHEQLAVLARQVSREFARTFDMAEVWASVPYDVAESRLSIRQDKAVLTGLDPAKISTAATRWLSGEVLGQIHVPQERQAVPVRLHVPQDQRVEPNLLERASIISPSGQRVPLSELTDITSATQTKPIHHKNGERVHYVGGELADSAPVYAVLDLDRRLDGIESPDNQALSTGNLRFNNVRPSALRGYQLLWEGELRLTLDAFRDMGMALGLALMGIYLLLVAYYRSFGLPLLAMTAVPLAFIGVFPGHWLFGQAFSAASMVGVIALAGVVVRNSLLLIDFAREYQAQGYSLDEAVLEAGAVRLRPILLTTMAIVLGTAIMIPDPVFGGLAIALIFGVLSSAVLSVILVPLLYRRWAISVND
ncbi:MAG: efflux RND transporter permease subunit [Candidatus Thiodiazotropha sp. (ex Troendleina suluensis)]|nr:efflux RND transporter permease subunit [Candidatus Thiodiazotropha sp. (ex Troendleina suluensis)]